MALYSQQILLLSSVAFKYGALVIHWILESGCEIRELLPVWRICDCQRQINRTATRVITNNRAAHALHLVTPAVWQVDPKNSSIVNTTLMLIQTQQLRTAMHMLQTHV